jgi:hypothetical protein
MLYGHSLLHDAVLSPSMPSSLGPMHSTVSLMVHIPQTLSSKPNAYLANDQGTRSPDLLGPAASP